MIDRKGVASLVLEAKIRPMNSLQIISRDQSAALEKWVLNHRAGLLVAMLGLLHLAYVQGLETVVGRGLMMGHFGLFLVWQPFVRAEARLAWGGGLALLVFPLVALWFMSNWMLVVWMTLLAGLIGGRVFFFSERTPRIFYLLALSYVIGMLLLAAVPVTLPSRVDLGAGLVLLAHFGLPVLLLLMSLIPLRTASDVGEDAIDLAFSMFVMLLLAVLVLGAVTLTLLTQGSYLQSLATTLFAVAGMLLFASWVWNPKAGFTGLGALVSRYMLSVGLPLEQWLHSVAELSVEEKDPEAFLVRATEQISSRLPWVVGGRWQTAERTGSFGQREGVETRFSRKDLTLWLNTRNALTPSLVWHFNLVTELIEQFYRAKVKEREMREFAYLRAIHETGARLTHDMKNLLQSLNSMMFAAKETHPDGSVALGAMIQRQMPLIIQRLQTTVDKLSAPGKNGMEQGDGDHVDALVWWMNATARYLHRGVEFLPPEGGNAHTLDESLFSSALENLLQNALSKKAQNQSIEITAMLWEEGGRWCMSVTDTGPLMQEDLSRDIGRRPVASENGLGIGLYQLARSAALARYRLSLEENRTGCVRFSLLPDGEQ